MSRAASRTAQIRKPAVKTQKGLVTAQNRIAAQIGADVLTDGGNAVDAAIATSFALGVVEPWMSGIGGGGYMVIRQPGANDAQVVDFGMGSPVGLRQEDYQLDGGKASDLFPWPSVRGNANITGAKAVAVPGLVAGMDKAHCAFGSMPWKDLLAPAIAEAQEGLLVDWYAQLILASSAKELARFPASKAVYLDAEGYPKSSQWTAIRQSRCDQSNLAHTLAMIAEEGAGTFYRGALAESIVCDLQAAGGRHNQEDFDTYRASIVPASSYSYRGHTIFGTPEMTSGPTLQRTLELLSDWQPGGTLPDAEDFAQYDRAIRQANKERMATMGDHEQELMPSCTTHFNVVDKEGMMVSVTQTLLSIFGSRLTLPDSGILMNNGIMWFDPEPGKPNSIGPGKRCLANMCPTIVERNDGAVFGLGAAGGRKIMPAVAQLISYILDFNMDIEQAMHMPRIDASIADFTVADDKLSLLQKNELKKLISNIVFAPRTTYPYNFACPSIAARVDEISIGISEIMSYWAETVAEAD